jgi:hypothetical protein
MVYILANRKCLIELLQLNKMQELSENCLREVVKVKVLSNEHLSECDILALGSHKERHHAHRQ